MIKKIKDEKGQIIVFVVLSILSLAMFWMMLINIAKMVKDRIMLQNAADSAAQTIACIRARALNMIGSLNALLGIPSGAPPPLLPALGIPEFVWWVCPEQHFWVPCDHFAKPAKAYVDKIIKSQEDINKAYGGGWAFIQATGVARRQEINRKGEPCGADKIIPLDSLSLRLHRNKGDVWYWGTIWVATPDYTGPLPVPPQVKGILVRNGKRWYEQDDKFHKKKLRIVAHKDSNSLSNRGYPIGKIFFGIKKMPGISAIAAARPYNAIGPMFPKKGQKFGLAATEEFLPFFLKQKGWDAQLVPVGAPYQH